jgi:hypothetical protein
MKFKELAPRCLALLVVGLLATGASSAPSAPSGTRNVTVTVIDMKDVLNARATGAPVRLRQRTMSSTSNASVSPVSVPSTQNGGGNSLPLWTFDVQAARDGLHHRGAMLGTSPFGQPQTSRIPVIIVPLILHTHSIAVSFDPNTGIFTTAPGDVVSDPSHPDTHCLTAPNNVPSQLVAQSPLFQSTSFSFGGIHLGTTQYLDAFMRGNFYQALQGDPGLYHVLFDPVTVGNPVIVDLPANEGLAIRDPLLLGPPAFCPPEQIIDYNWIDSYLNGTVLPMLTRQGLTPGTIPLFVVYNTAIASPVTNLGACCILGYHYFAGEPKPSQTYAISTFDAGGFFSPTIENTSVMAHELGELMDDPYTNNDVPPWGNVGQVQGGCQGNLEVGDPLTGTIMPTITMPNGYTYNVQELVFFSWFYGGQSLGVNGWYSSNGTFTTDAGSVCP